MRRFFVLLVAVLFIAASVRTQSVRAAGDWYVSTNGNDTNDCRSAATACRTLGAAIEKAESGDVLYVGAGVYTENLSFGKDLSIHGLASGAVIDGGGIDRVMEILGGTVSLNSITIRNGSGRQAGDHVAGIYNEGELSLSDVTVSYNRRDTYTCAGIYNANKLSMYRSRVTDNQTSEDWAGICNDGDALIRESVISRNSATGYGAGINNRGRLELIASTISDNVAEADGGGILNSGTAVIVNSTISGNRTSSRGKGGGIATRGTLELINSTITNNVARRSNGGGVSAEGGTTTIRGTIIGGNRVDEESDQGPDCVGVLTSVEGSLIQDLESCVIQGGSNNRLGVDPKLGPLRDNGGETQTHALLSGSPAIDAASSTACPATDQRGVERPLDGNGDGTPVCDIGAFEYGTLPAASTMTPTPTRTSIPPAPTQTLTPVPPGGTAAPPLQYRVYLPLAVR